MRLLPVKGINPQRAAFALLLVLLFFTAEISSAQNGMPLFSNKYQRGVQLYKASRWHEAAAEFRYAQEIAANMDDLAQALYWIILTELALGDYGSAIRDMDELERAAPASPYVKEMVFHRARAYFNNGYFEDALSLFKRYGDGIPSSDTEAADRKAASYFWMGECLYSMGQFDEAEKFYSWVISKYPASPKVDVSSYRIDLIKQKKIEAELLALLRWSHEESLRTSEDYQRRIRTYEATLNTYQRRIAELSRGQENAEISTPVVVPVPVPAPAPVPEVSNNNRSNQETALIPEPDLPNADVQEYNQESTAILPPVVIPPPAALQPPASSPPPVASTPPAARLTPDAELVDRAKNLVEELQRMIAAREQDIRGLY